MLKNIKKLILGSRGSPLAIAQSQYVIHLINQYLPLFSVQLLIIKTEGDLDTDIRLDQSTQTGIFTKKIEDALLNHQIDLAVHSLKDLPLKTPQGLLIAAIVDRKLTDDILISKSPGGLNSLPIGSSLGTSSPRRALFIQQRRPDISIFPIRGNLDTRLRKIATDEFCATILAGAGLERLGYLQDKIFIEDQLLWMDKLSWMLPAPGQGAIAIETRSDEIGEVLFSLNDPITERCVTAERQLLSYLGGGCHLPLGALATEKNGLITLQGSLISNTDQRTIYSGIATAFSANEVAHLVARQILQSH